METSRAARLGARVKLARLLRGLTQAELAKEVAVSAAFMCQVEAGNKPPGDLLLDAISTFLGLERRFFERGLGEEFRDEECYFRRRRTTPLYSRNRVLAQGTLFTELVQELENHIDFPAENVPTIEALSPEQIEAAAESCRNHWELGLDTPIRNLTRVLENAGIVVARFDGGSEKIDAFSRAGARRIIVLSSDKSPGRTRFDLAHECGHLVMHVGLDASNSELEPQADAFASAFLLPRRGFIPEFPRGRSWSWPAIFEMKKRWGVSLAAIIRRAYTLQLINPLEYQRAYKYISMKGWRTAEPFDEHLPEESPETIPTALRVLEEEGGVWAVQLANELGWSPEMFTQITGYPCPAAPKGISSLAAARARSRRNDHGA